MMEMYKTEKINPLGGCLPIVVQIPVFIALYWVLLSAVELRHAPWIWWIHDLSAPDPYFVLPVIYAITAYLQVRLSPTPIQDPVQAKVMQIMPIAFSVDVHLLPVGPGAVLAGQQFAADLPAMAHEPGPERAGGGAPQPSAVERWAGPAPTTRRTMALETDVIAAVATPPGRGGIGVVRVSGPDLSRVVDGIVGRVLHPRVATLARFLDARGDVLDEGLALLVPRTGVVYGAGGARASRSRRTCRTGTDPEALPRSWARGLPFPANSPSAHSLTTSWIWHRPRASRISSMPRPGPRRVRRHAVSRVPSRREV